MDRLTGEFKNIPIYAENLYKWTPEPSILKQDVDWDAPTLEDLECPYCREENAQDIFYNGNIFIYIDPTGYLRYGNLDGVGAFDIAFCPMCGRQLI